MKITKISTIKKEKDKTTLQILQRSLEFYTVFGTMYQIANLNYYNHLDDDPKDFNWLQDDFDSFTDWLTNYFENHRDMLSFYCNFSNTLMVPEDAAYHFANRYGLVIID